MSDREIVDVSLEEYGFSFHVVKLPEEVVIDKLALVSPETGLISRIEYQNFLFAETILNLERLFGFVADATGGDPEFQIKIRNEIEVKICEVNPSFDSTILIISKSGVIKPSILGDGIPLATNADWDKIDDSLNPFIIVEEIEIVDEAPPEEESLLPGVPAFPTPVPTVKRTWERTKIEIEIRKFLKSDLPAILGPVQSFPNEVSYKIFIVNQCVVKANSLFALIDSMGLVDDIPIPTITDEIYRLCVDVNPFLGYDDFKEIDVKNIRKPSPSNPSGSPSRRTQKKNKKVERKGTKEFSAVTKKELLTLSARMNQRIVGQSEAINQIVETIQIASCGLRNQDKPIASYLLCGTTGIGKTLCAKVLAEELCGSRDAIVRIDCSEYGEPHTVQKLIGAPASYVGYEDGGVLTNAVMEHPFSIVLFDEIEKAHSRVFDVLLQIMDDARLTDGKGNTASFKDCIILLTSNIGVSETEAVKGTMGFGDEGSLTEERRGAALKKALKNRFRPEFLNRLDNTINFRSLTQEDAIVIIGLLLDKVNENLARRSIKADFSAAVKEMIFKKGFSKKYGARPLERAIEKSVVSPLAQMILRDEIRDGTTIKVDYKKDKLLVKELKARPISSKRTVIKV